MKTKIILLGSMLAAFVSSAQTNALTFTNNSGIVYSNATVVKIETDGVLFGFTNWQYARVKFTNMPASIQKRFGYDPEAIRKANEERIAQAELNRKMQQEAARQQAELAAESNREMLKWLTATNLEEQKIDAMQDNPTNMSPDEKSARDGLLKALLDISSSTSVGVNRNDYGALLAKANSALAFSQTKLSVERHGKFLLCAAKAIGYYSKANDDWSDYFKYDWEREQDETLMSGSDFYDLKQGGLPVDASIYKYYKNENNNDLFYVPFKASLNLYWQAADIYVHKMQSDAASLP
jgi:hypothetical protein